MRELKGIAHLPFARPTGGMVTVPGYDEETGIFAHFDPEALPEVPTNPTKDQITGAIQTAWKPWSEYRFSSVNDRAAMLAGIMTAVCRPALDICPGFFADAPTQASGKTKAVGALGVLMKGRRAGVIPYSGGESANDEMRKKLVALAVEGEDFILIDNVVGHWKSSALASVMTEGWIKDRLLGGNQWYSGPVRALITATGNNASLDYDLGRRFIRVRLDPGCACPQARVFAFDPVDLAGAMRLAIAHSVLVLVQAYQAAGAPALGVGDCGFSQWNRLVRRCVLWLIREGHIQAAGLGDWNGADPAASILDGAAAQDPEEEACAALFMALRETFGGEFFTASELHKFWLRGSGEIWEALSSMLPGKRDVTPISLGRVLRNRRDKIVGGLVLQGIGDKTAGSTVWLVRPHAG